MYAAGLFRERLLERAISWLVLRRIDYWVNSYRSDGFTQPLERGRIDIMRHEAVYRAQECQG